jgi:hypothetical protein
MSVKNPLFLKFEAISPKLGVLVQFDRVKKNIYLSETQLINNR